MDIREFLNDWWPLIVVICPALAVIAAPQIVRVIALVMSLALIISILRKQNEQKKNAEPKVQPQGSAA